MRKMISKLNRRQRGQILVLALIFLVIGALLIPPTLALSSTVLKSNITYNTNMDNFYAAESGIQDAIYKLQYDFENENIPKSTGDSFSYSFIHKINSSLVDVSISCLNFQDLNNEGQIRQYKITSTAIKDEKESKIEVIVDGIPTLLSNALTSNGDVGLIDNKGIIDGDVVASEIKNSGEITGFVAGDLIINNQVPPPEEIPLFPIDWPDSTELTDYYRYDSNDVMLPFYDFAGLLDIDDTSPASIAELNVFCDGYFQSTSGLGIEGHMEDTDTPITLNGTVFINGDFYMGHGADDNLYLDLNGQTIFCTGSVNISQSVEIMGSGAIIAIGNVTFEPTTSSGGEGDFVFVMSLEGEIIFKPSGDFWGSLAGYDGVTVQQGYDGTITWTNPIPAAFNIPIASGSSRYLISYWNSSRD